MPAIPSASHEMNRLLPLIAGHLLTIACRRAPGNRGFCGTYLGHVEQRLEDRLRRGFSLQELKALAALLDLNKDKTIPPELTAEETSSLLTRARTFIPAVRRTCGSRSDDEDVAAIVRSIIDPEPLTDAGDIDIPEN